MDNKTYPTLYTVDTTGRHRQWDLNVIFDGQIATITKVYGLCDGKKTTVKTEVKSGKNIGKSNETTIFQQAVLKADALYKKQMENGYDADISSLQQKITIKPMLAHSYFDGNKDSTKAKKIVAPFYIQPKLDGVRMIVGKMNDGTQVVMSRTGKTMYNMEHVVDELMPKLKNGEFIDGENFTFDLTFEEITGICRTSLKKNAKDKDSHKIKFHAFDYFNINDMEIPFDLRYSKLKEIQKGAKNTTLVSTKKENDKNNIDSYLSEYMKNGYEGVMVRNAKGKYKLDSRSDDLQKAKKFVSDEFEIVGYEQAEGRDAGTVIWRCKNENQVFSVRPQGTLEKRKEWYANGHDYVGKMLTVKYQNMTECGQPRFPIGIAIRDYE